MRRVFWIGAMALVVAVMAVFVVTSTVAAGPEACDNRVNNTHAKLLECMTVDGVREHQAAFQAIADANNGIRTSGTLGYDQSAAYVAARMTAAGYDVTVQEFQFQTFIVLSPSVLEQVTPADRTDCKQHHVLLGEWRRDGGGQYTASDHWL